MRRKAVNSWVEWQQRASGFSVGDVVVPYFDGAGEMYNGRVVQVFPAIGMVDVEFPHGTKRYPVEELQITAKAGEREALMPQTPSVPGGSGVVPVSRGPVSKMARMAHMAREVTALYWAGKDRKYRPSQAESDSGRFKCPRCKCPETGDPHYMVRKPYKREKGQSAKMFVCPHCTFMIKELDIIGLNEPEPLTMDQGINSKKQLLQS